MSEGAAGFTRRDFLSTGAAALGGFAGLDQFLPRFALAPHGLPAAPLRGQAGVFDLAIGRKTLAIGNRQASAVVINGSIPGPLLRFREGETVTLRVRNDLHEDTSIHWHGIILPNGMDGVPQVTFPGISPGETFTYRYPVAQNGTYWYHSHSGLQEQLGVYGPMIIDPAGPDPIGFDREYVVMLSDWTFEDPHKVLGNLKRMGGYFNFQRRTAADFFRDLSARGLGATLRDRLMWGRMRMDPTDIADITGSTYSYLMNGMPQGSNWTGIFRPGERVRLRFINGSAASFFDVRIPGLPLTVVQADGNNVQPVTVDEFRIAIAETYDVIVEPTASQAYTIFAEAMDRSGFARGTLAPQPGMSGALPARRRRPVRTMTDMGMDMAGMDMKDMPAAEHAGHEGMAMPAAAVAHGPDSHGPGNSMVAMMSQPRLSEPGIGLGEDGRRVLSYADLRSVEPWYDTRPPQREVELHLTGNMERFMWSFDGKKFSQAPQPIVLRLGERVKLTLVNDTMMEHPMHLHGMWSQLDNGAEAHSPRKHTVNVKPAERVSFFATPDVVGKWAFHCHVLYHMEVGMFRVVEVVEAGAGEGR